MAAIYSMIVAALSPLMEWSCLAYDADKPAAVSSIFTSSNDDVLVVVGVEAGEDNKSN
jgi:hypothetical protein